MDSPRSSQPSSLDSLRTVEFRQTLRGYHIDDVDEYLERVAVDAEAIQEQLRQANERLRPAAERVAQLEKQLAEAREQAEQAVQQAAHVAPGDSSVTDDTLQRTLLLAQRFVDETKGEAEMHARDTISKAEERARIVIAEAEGRARSVTADTERKLRDEVARLEALRNQLSNDVDTIAHHLDAERSRLRGALGEMLTWVDRHIQSGGSPLGGNSKRDVNGEGGAQDSDRARGAAAGARPS